MTKTKTLKNSKFLIFNIPQSFYNMFFSLIVILIMAIIIINPSLFSQSTINGIKLFFYSVLPNLFPFMFLTKMLTELGFVFKLTKKCSNFSKKLFGTPGVSIYCFLMSILSGYPIGAKIIADLYSKNLIKEEDAKRMSIFCTTSGPAFVIGAVGVGMLSSFKLGVIIYASHVLSSLILIIIYNLIFKNKQMYQTNIIIEKHKTDNIFSMVLNETIASLFMVGGYITIFYLFTETLSVLNIIPFISKILSSLLSFANISAQEFSAILFGITEVTHGVKDLSIIGSECVPIICGLISFSGISIIMQSMSFLKQTKIKTHTFIFFKCVLMIISYFICKLLIFFC